MPNRIVHILVGLALALSVLPASVRAAAPDDDMSILQMYYDESDLKTSVTRNAVPLSSVAETISVITAADIAAMNAHTVGDVLIHVPGVQAPLRGGPGTSSAPSIRGGNFNHVRVLIDGIPLNDILSSYPDVDAIPARIVERIEVLRGPASSSWGSALGGVISIVTKHPEGEKKFSGSAYASAGEQSFHDVGGDLSGTVGNLGYYLYGGNLAYGGLAPNNSVTMNSGHAKLIWDLGGKGELTGVFGVSRPDRTTGGYTVFDDSTATYLYAGLSGRYSLRADTELEVSLHFTEDNNSLYQGKPTRFGFATMVSGNTLPTGGGAVILRHQAGAQSLATGFEFDTGRISRSATTTIATINGPWTLPVDTSKARLNRYGYFLTDTITLGDFSLTPSLRYDWTAGRLSRSDFSFSVGGTYRLTDGTLLRVTGGKGYSLPDVGTGEPVEKIWGVQAGVESTDLPYLWTRATYFYNHLERTIDAYRNIEDQHRQGVELEAKTVPVYHTSLTGGLMLMETMSERTHRTVKYMPTWQWNAGVRYDDGSLGVSLLGHQVWWNTDGAFGSEYDDAIWDLHLSKKLKIDGFLAPELFFSLHNVFGGSEYQFKYFKNPGRWAEGGIRFSF